MDFRAYAIALVQRDMDEAERADEAIGAGLARRSSRATNTPSVVFSVRLDVGELRALETRAAATGVKPSVLARNLIRSGLAARTSADVTDVLDRLTTVTDELRAMVT
ncbi:MAG TPA: hypothetical protein VGN35_06645 [Jatrophihabitantaceae bacterium]|jgi:hypothetical protein|nr:hypothetical protein [Jatrophihabitantaceae bacterium]